MNTQWYRMHDADPRGVFEIEPEEATYWNERGCGVFATVNSFAGPRRKENLRRINAWAVDLDDGTKEQQAERLLRSPLIPSAVVETKRGYQAYWYAQDGAQADHWNAIVLERLVPMFGADKNARDLCRILRVPGFNHLKDPADPFMVRVVWEHHVQYSERQMAKAFPWTPDQTVVEQERKAAQTRAREAARLQAIAAGMSPTETLWDAIYALDSQETLLRLSGTHWVGGETYTFRRTGRGNLNIFVNGKSSSCFIDSTGHIGSPLGFGPTPAQWLRFWKHSWKEIIVALKSMHPHLSDIDDAARKNWSPR